MDKRPAHRIGLVFLHDACSSGADIASFFSSIPLESFGDKSFTEVCDILGIQIHTPTAQIRSGTDEEVDPSLFWEWYAVSPDWRVLGLENTLDEDRASMDASKQQLSLMLSEVEQRCDYVFIGGFAHGGNMVLELLNENHRGILQTHTNQHSHRSSLQRKHPKVTGVFTLASFLPNSSSILSHVYENTSNEHKMASSVASTPPLAVLMLHGKEDSEVPCDWGRVTAAQLTLHEGVDVRFQTFPEAEHEIAENQLHVLLDWIEATVNASKASAEDGILFQHADAQQEAPAKQDPSCQFQIQAVPEQGANAYRVIYPGAEPDVVHALTGRPVLANGGMFDITEAPGGGVQCIVFSANPEKTAVAIGERLVAR